MTDVGNHTKLVNGSRGEDGAIAAVPVIPPLDLSRVWPPQPGIPAALPLIETPEGVTELAPVTPSWRLALKAYPWPLLVIAAPAAVAIWSGWVGLGELCGFGPIHPLPGIAPQVVINTAITLPIGVEAYGAYALHAWLGGKNISAPTRSWARGSAIAALVLGCLGQIAFHLLSASHWKAAPWPIVTAVSCLPVATLAFAAALAHMIRADSRVVPGGDSDGMTEEVTEPAPEPSPEPVPEVAPAAVNSDGAGDDNAPPVRPAAPVTRQPRKPAAKPSARKPSGRDRAAAALAKNPGATNAELAAEAGVDVRTIQRARNGRAAPKG